MLGDILERGKVAPSVQSVAWLDHGKASRQYEQFESYLPINHQTFFRGESVFMMRDTG